MKYFMFILAILCFSCGGDKEFNQQLISEPTLALFYCDMSKSGNDAAVTTIHNKIMKAYDVLPYGTEIEIHALNFPGNSKLLMSFSKPTEKPKRDIPSEIEKHKLLLNRYRKAIFNKSLDTLQSVYDLDDGKKNSCILNVFEYANDIFSSKGKEWKKELYIFSDFIEDCSSSLNGKYLSIYDDDRMKAASRILNEWSPKYFDSNTKVRLIFTENTDINRKISYSDLKNFWKQVHVKINPNDSLFFSPRIDE